MRALQKQKLLGSLATEALLLYDDRSGRTLRFYEVGVHGKLC